MLKHEISIILFSTLKIKLLQWTSLLKILKNSHEILIGNEETRKGN